MKSYAAEKRRKKNDRSTGSCLRTVFRKSSDPFPMQSLSIQGFRFSHLFLNEAKTLVIYSPTPAFALTLAMLATLCKAFPCQKTFFYLFSPFISRCSVASWLPSLPKNWHAAAEARPDVKRISPDHKATCAVKS